MLAQAAVQTPENQRGVPDEISTSSPFKAGPSIMPPLGLKTPESQEAQRTATKKRFRPLSPPTTGDEPADSCPHPSAKRRKTTTLALHSIGPILSFPLRQGVPATPKKRQGVFGSGDSANKAKRTPTRPLGAAEGFEGVDDVGIVGRVTPRKREQSLTPLLASSHKVMPRPRPPLKKSLPLEKSGASPKEIIESDDDEGLILHGSPKVYFSSPASSTSSTPAGRGNKGSHSLRALDHPNPNFTIDPEAFAPLFTSTQNGPEGDGSGGGGRALSKKRTGSSPGLLKFNSQFDVDKNVEDAIALLERDVDVDNWFADLSGDLD